MTATSSGFFRPTTTPTPDEIFDVWLSELSGSELKVLLYIVRRTLGFKKDKDSISLAQICNGITTRDGRILDRGTGISKTTAYKAVNKLEQLGLVIVERSKTDDESNAVNVYSLRFRAFGDPNVDNSDDSPKGGLTSEQGVGQKLTQGGLETNPGVDKKHTPQQTVEQHTDGQQTDKQPPPADGPVEESGLPAAGAGILSSVPETFPSDSGIAVKSPEELQAVEQLVAFGVWRSRAASAVNKYRLTPGHIERACAAVRREAAQGTKFDNAPAVLLARLKAGWEPPDKADVYTKPCDWDQSFIAHPPPRQLLPPITDASGNRRDPREWFGTLKEELQLQLPRETYDAWLRTASLLDHRPATENRRGELVIHLQNQRALEWVQHRFHKVIERLVKRMSGTELEIRYVATEHRRTVATIDRELRV